MCRPQTQLAIHMKVKLLKPWANSACGQRVDSPRQHCSSAFSASSLADASAFWHFSYSAFGAGSSAGGETLLNIAYLLGFGGRAVGDQSASRCQPWGLGGFFRRLFQEQHQAWFTQMTGQSQPFLASMTNDGRALTVLNVSGASINDGSV